MIGNLFVISGPSGVGKDTLMALIFNRLSKLNRWVTCTTRKPRPNEVDGQNYFFKTPDEFKLMIDNNELVEFNEFAGNFYGTPKQYAVDMLNKGKDIITAIDVNGAQNVKKAFPQAHLIFIEPPSIDELRARLLKRGTESAEYIEKRLAIVSSELSKKDMFDICIVNDSLDAATNSIVDYINQFSK